MPNVILTHKSFARRYFGTFISCFLWPPFELENVDPAFLTIASLLRPLLCVAEPDRSIVRVHAQGATRQRRSRKESQRSAEWREV